MDFKALYTLLSREPSDDDKNNILRNLLSDDTQISPGDLPDLAKVYRYDDGRSKAMKILVESKKFDSIPFATIVQTVKQFSSKQFACFETLYTLYNHEHVSHEEAVELLVALSYPVASLACSKVLVTKLPNISSEETLKLYTTHFDEIIVCSIFKEKITFSKSKEQKSKKIDGFCLTMNYNRQHKETSLQTRAGFIPIRTFNLTDNDFIESKCKLSKDMLINGINEITIHFSKAVFDKTGNCYITVAGRKISFGQDGLCATHKKCTSSIMSGSVPKHTFQSMLAGMLIQYSPQIVDEHPTKESQLPKYTDSFSKKRFSSQNVYGGMTIGYIGVIS